MSKSVECVIPTIDIGRNVPSFSLEDVFKLANEHFAIEGKAKPLASERDQSFLFTTKWPRKIYIKNL